MNDAAQGTVSDNVHGVVVQGSEDQRPFGAR